MTRSHDKFLLCLIEVMLGCCARTLFGYKLLHTQYHSALHKEFDRLLPFTTRQCRVHAGSSGGTAASVAMRLAPAGFCSDTGMPAPAYLCESWLTLL